MLPFMSVLQNKFLLTVLLAFGIYNICFADESSLNKKLLFVRNNSVWIYDFSSKKELELIKNADNPSCSPNGKQVAFTRNYNVWILDIKTGKQNKITKLKSLYKMEIQKLDWSPQNFILFERIESYRVVSLNEKDLVFWPDDAFEPKSRNFLLPSIWIVKKNELPKKFIGYTGYGSATTGTHLNQVQTPAWSPDGKKIAFSRNGDIWMAKVETLDNKKEERIFPSAYLENSNGASPLSRGASNISWSPDGKRLVFSISRMYGSGVGELWIVEPDGSNSKKISSKGYEQWPIFLDKKVIIFSDGYNLRTIDIDGTNEKELIHNAIKPCLCR